MVWNKQVDIRMMKRSPSMEKAKVRFVTLHVAGYGVR